MKLWSEVFAARAPLTIPDDARRDFDYCPLSSADSFGGNRYTGAVRAGMDMRAREDCTNSRQ